MLLAAALSGAPPTEPAGLSPFESAALGSVVGGVMGGVAVGGGAVGAGVAVINSECSGLWAALTAAALP